MQRVPVSYLLLVEECRLVRVSMTNLNEVMSRLTAAVDDLLRVF